MQPASSDAQRRDVQDAIDAIGDRKVAGAFDKLTDPKDKEAVAEFVDYTVRSLRQGGLVSGGYQLKPQEVNTMKARLLDRNANPGGIAQAKALIDRFDRDHRLERDAHDFRPGGL